MGLKSYKNTPNFIFRGRRFYRAIAWADAWSFHGSPALQTYGSVIGAVLYAFPDLREQMPRKPLGLCSPEERKPFDQLASQIVKRLGKAGWFGVNLY